VSVSLAGLAAQLADTAVANLDREFPCAPAHVIRGPDDAGRPRVRHPAFFGAYDWHSSVHAHWLLVRLLRTHPERVDEEAVRGFLRARLAPKPLLVEAAYLLADPAFERPYGWAWLLTLAAECASLPADADAAAWAQALEPAVSVVAELAVAWLRLAQHPVREGGHANSALALGLFFDAAGSLVRPGLTRAVREQAVRWYVGDRDAPAGWEPSGQDFLSPSLTEADLVRRLLPPAQFTGWLTGLLPGLAAGEPASLLHPVPVPDRSDGRIGHLDGLNFSRSAALRSIGDALARDDPRRPVLFAALLRRAVGALTAARSRGLVVNQVVSGGRRSLRRRLAAAWDRYGTRTDNTSRHKGVPVDATAGLTCGEGRAGTELLVLRRS